MEFATPNSEEVGLLRRDIDRLKSDLRQMRADLSGLATDSVGAAKAGAAVARDTLDQTMKDVAAKGKESVEAIEEQVALHPYMSLAAAFAVGTLVGCRLSRKG